MHAICVQGRTRVHVRAVFKNKNIKHYDKLFASFSFQTRRQHVTTRKRSLLSPCRNGIKIFDIVDLPQKDAN